MAIVATGELAVTPDLKGFESKMGSSLGRIAKGAAAAFGGAFAATQAIGFIGDAIGDAREANAIAAQTAAAIKSTGGAAKVSAKQVDDLANAISRKTGIDDEEIAKTENLLLTFTNLRNEVGKGNDIFSQATSIAADMGKALGQDASSSAIQLGKALNDPIKGITALTRVGVTFTDVQKKQIENFVASGNIMGAQKVILQELTKEFGGSAEAQATSADKLKVTIGNLKEEIGNALIPIIDKVAGFLSEKLPGAIDFTKQKLGEFWTAMQPVRDYIANTLAPALQNAADTLLPKIQDAIDKVGGAFRDNKPQIEEIGRAIKTITPLVVALGAVFETLVINQIAGVGAAFTSLVGVTVKAWDGIVDVIRKSVNNIIDAINLFISAYNKIPILGNIDKLGHVSFGTTKPGGGQTTQRKPAFAEGGMVPGRIGAPIEAIVHGGERVLTPAQQRAASGPLVGQIVIQGATFEGADATAVSVVRELRAEAYRQGK